MKRGAIETKNIQTIKMKIVYMKRKRMRIEKKLILEIKSFPLYQRKEIPEESRKEHYLICTKSFIQIQEVIGRVMMTI